MPKTINLLKVSKERVQSEFPDLNNANMQQVRDAINELYLLADQDQTTLASISGSLGDDIETLRGDVQSTTDSLQQQIGQINTDLNEYTLKTETVAISSHLSGRIDAITQSISGSIADILENDLGISGLQADVTALSAQHISDIYDINTNIAGISGSINDVLISDYAPLTTVASISADFNTRLNYFDTIDSVATSATIDDHTRRIGNLETKANTLTGQTKDLDERVTAISGELQNRPTYGEVIDSINDLGGTALTGPTITTSEIITEYNLARPVDITADEVIILGGTPSERDRAIFYDISNNANANSATISGGDFSYILDDNSGAVHIEYRNGKWVAMSDLDTKFYYDSNGNITTRPNTGIIATKHRSGSLTQEYKFDLTSTYDTIETNVEQTSAHFSNTFTPGTTPFNDGNYQIGEYDPYTVTALSHDSNNFAWKALDGNTGTGWVSQNPEADYITLDLGANNGKQFTGFRFFNGGVVSERPTDFAIQASNDFLVWDELLVVNGDNSGVSQWSTLYNIYNFGNYRFYRVNIFDTNSGGKVRINEIEFREGIEATFNNTFSVTVYQDTQPLGFAPLTLQVYDESVTNIIGEGKVEVAYSINDDPFSAFVDLETFRKLPSINNAIKLELKFRMLGSQKYTGFKIENSSSFVEHNGNELRVVTDGEEVLSANSDGSLIAKRGEFGVDGEFVLTDTLDFFNGGTNIAQSISGWSSVGVSGNSFDVDMHDGETTGFNPDSLEIIDGIGTIINDTTVNIQYNINGNGFGTTSYTVPQFKELDKDIFVSCDTLTLRLSLDSGITVSKVNLRTSDNIIKIKPSGDLVLERNGVKAFEVRSDGTLFSDHGTFGIRGQLFVNGVLEFELPQVNVDTSEIDHWGNVDLPPYATTNNTWQTEIYNGLASSFNVASIILRDADGEIISTDTVNLDYAVNGVAFTGSLLPQSSFKALDPSIFEGVTQLNIKLQSVGAQRVSKIEINKIDTLVELTNDGYLQIRDSGKPVVRVNKDGLFADVNGQWVPNTFTTVETSISGSGTVIDTIDETLGNSVEWSAFVTDGTNMVATKIMAIWDGNGTVNFNEVRTPAIGDVSAIDFSVDESGDQIRLIGDASIGTWNTRVKRTFI